MLQPKDTDWLNGYKNKTHIYAVCKKPTSELKTHRLKVRGWKNIFHANGKQKKAGVAILISDKIEGFPCGSAVKESAFNTGDLGSIPGLGRSPGEGKDYPFQ